MSGVKAGNSHISSFILNLAVFILESIFISAISLFSKSIFPGIMLLLRT